MSAVDPQWGGKEHREERARRAGSSARRSVIAEVVAIGVVFINVGMGLGGV